MDVRTVSTQTHVRYTHLWILSKPLDGLVKGNLLACVLIINSIQYQFTPRFFNTDTFFNRSTSRFEHFRCRSRDDSPSAAAQAAIGHMVWTSWVLVTTGVSVITTSVSFYKITTGVSIGKIVWFLWSQQVFPWSQQVFPWSLYRCFQPCDPTTFTGNRLDTAAWRSGDVVLSPVLTLFLCLPILIVDL